MRLALLALPARAHRYSSVKQMSSASCTPQSTRRLQRLTLKLLILRREHLVVRGKCIGSNQTPNLVADQFAQHGVEPGHDASPFPAEMTFVRIHLAASSGCIARSIHTTSMESSSPLSILGS